MWNAIGFARQLRTGRHQRDVARYDLATVVAKRNKVENKNNELCFALEVLRGSVQECHSSMLSFLSQVDIIFVRLPPSNDIADGLF